VLSHRDPRSEPHAVCPRITPVGITPVVGLNSHAPAVTQTRGESVEESGRERLRTRRMVTDARPGLCLGPVCPVVGVAAGLR